MKQYLFFIFTILATDSMSAQQPTLEIAWAKEEVIINKIPVNVHSSLADIRKALGPESRVLSADDRTTRLYIYDQLGLNFVIDTVAGKLDKLDIYWLPGRITSEDSPKELFKGDLHMNGEKLSVTDGIAVIKNKTNIPFEKMGLFYWYTADHGEFSITMAYATRAEEKIRSVYILFRTTPEQ